MLSDEKVALDTTVFNAARIVKLPGTVARKGDSTSERPHRVSRVVASPIRDKLVTTEQLQAVAALLPEEPATTGYKGSGSAFDLENWLRDHAVPVRGPMPYNGSGRKWLVEHGQNCLFGGAHDARGNFIVQFSSGAIAAGCLHNSCNGLRWQDFRKKYEPEYDPSRTWQAGSADSQPSSSAQSANFCTISEYLAQVKARSEKRAFWAGILREGEVSLLLGRPYAGKSTFACALTRALHFGIPLLDHSCVKTRVGYMALERNGAYVARRFQDWGIDVAFLDEVPALVPDELAVLLENEIVRLGLEVVIVDHVQNLVRVSNANDYAEVSNSLDPLLRVAKKTGAHLMLLHHQGKGAAREEIDAMGSEAYRAAADVLIEASKSGEGHSIRAIIRGGDDLPKTRITVNLETGEVEGIPADQAEIKDAAAKIAGYLKERGDSLTANVIQEAVALKREVVGDALKALLKAGTIERSGAGKKGDPFLYFSSQRRSGNAGTESDRAQKEPDSEIQFPNSEGTAGTESQNPRKAQCPVREIQFPTSREPNPDEPRVPPDEFYEEEFACWAAMNEEAANMSVTPANGAREGIEV